MMGGGYRANCRAPGQTCLMIAVSEEKAVDYEITARIATEAFGSKEVVFSAPRMKWLYESGFGQGSAIVAVFDDGKKVGQIALLHQKVYLDGEPAAATQLVDLFILQAYRSPHLVRRIYKEVERLCQAEGDPPGPHICRMRTRRCSMNACSKLRPFLSLQPRVGSRILGGHALAKPKYSGLPQIDDRARRRSNYCRASSPRPAENGLHWDARDLVRPLERSDPRLCHSCHGGPALDLIVPQNQGHQATPCSAASLLDPTP